MGWTTLNLVDPGFAKSAREAVNADIVGWRKRRTQNLHRLRH